MPDGFNGYRYRATSPSGSQITYTTNTDRDRILSVVTAAGTTSYQYDTQKRLTRITMPEGNYVAYTYDSRGNVTEVRRVAKSGSGLPDMVTSAGFAASCTNDINCDRAQWTRDERGNQTDFAYHATTGQLLSVTLPAAATGTDRPQTRYSYTSLTAYYRDASGNLGPSDTPMSLLTQISECVNAISCAGGANERVTAIGYGPTNVPTNLLPLSVTLRSGDNAVSSTSTTTYDNLGAVLIIDGPLPGAADTTRFRYDSAGRLIGTIGPDPDGSGGNPHPAERINYNSSGLPISAESGTVSGQLDIDWANFSPSRRVEQDYDLNLRPTVSRLMSGSTTYSLTQTGYDEDGRVKCVAQRMNPAEFASLPADACALDTEGTGANAFGPDRIIRTYYDAAGRVTQVRSAYGVSGQETNDATTTYTANSQVETLTDAEGNRTTYEYDGHDRLRNLRYPSPTTDGVSAPTSGTGADYQQLTYATATVGGSTVSTPLVAGVQLRDASSIGFTYDNLGRLTIKVVPERSGLSSTHTRDVYYAYDLLGRLTEARFDSLSGPGVSNGYNALGRLTYTSTTMDGTTRTLSYQYDAAGRRTRITHPDSAYFVYEYDTLGRLTGIDENGSSDIQTQSYHATGEVYLDGRTGSVRGWLYDPVGRPYYQINDMPSSAGTSWTMTRNPADQVISNVRSNDAYAWGGHHQVNRSYVADGLNRYTAVGGASYSYDANGNLTGDGTRTWTYDRENRLVGASGGVELGYDPLGRLAWSTGSPNLTRFVWDDWSLVAEYSSSGTVAERYVHGDGIDNPIFWYHGSAVGISNRRQFLTDPLGSIVAITDGYGVRTNVNSYDEYGVPASGNVGRFQYTGQIWLPELGMQYSRNRIYWPTLGRFMQTDPIGYGDGTNIYAYVGNDPVNFTDPSGLQSNCDDVRLIGFQGSTPVFRCSSGSSSQTRNLLAVFANNAWVGPTQADDRDRLTREQEQLLQREALRRLRARPQAELCPGNGSVFGTIADYAQSFGDFADGVAIGAAGLGLITAPTGVGGAFFGGTALVAGVVGRIASGVAALANFADGNNRGAAADAAGIVGGRIAGKFVGRVATNAYARNRMFRDLNAGQERRVRFYGDTTAAAASRVASRAICG